jgi:hypothetical protein
MNQLIQEHLFSIILFLLFIILLLMGVIVFVLFKLLNDKNNSTVSPVSITPPPDAPKNSEQDFKEIARQKLKNEIINEKYYCHNHKESNSVGGCLICEDVFCESCLVEHEGMYFCRDHFKIFANNKWEQITDEKTTPDTPDDGLYIWNFKRHIWKNKNIPSFVLTHYKINVHDDFIESYVQLNVVADSSSELKTALLEFKAK